MSKRNPEPTGKDHHLLWLPADAVIAIVLFLALAAGVYRVV
jgi:hypothetical protein